MSLSSWKGGVSAFSGIQILLQTMTEPEDSEQVKMWPKTCDEDHLKCKHPTKAFVPTRLIDVGTLDRSQPPQILLETKVEDKHAQYVALSYCWGSHMPEHVKTTTQNIADRLTQGFDPEMLPRTIKDALDFTRALGLRYMWIDVLCIVQDSELDWATESKTMGQVYSSAYCTLAASTSLDANSGLYSHNTADSDHSDAILTFNSDRQESPLQICISARHWMHTLDYWSSDPLQTRGWTLQERHLSRRVVHFLDGALFFECKEAKSSTDLPYMWIYLDDDNQRLFDGDNCDQDALTDYLARGG